MTKLIYHKSYNILNTNFFVEEHVNAKIKVYFPLGLLLLNSFHLQVQCPENNIHLFFTYLNRGLLKWINFFCSFNRNFTQAKSGTRLQNE